LDVGILLPIALDDCRIKGLAVMKLHPLAQGHLQRTVIDPTPTGGETWDGFSPLVEIREVLEDVKHHRDKIKAAAIDNAQFPTRRGHLFPQAPVAPPDGHEHNHKTANHEVFHDRASRARWWDTVLPSLSLSRGGYKRKTLIFLLYYTPPEATDLDHSLTVLRRILTKMIKARPLWAAERGDRRGGDAVDALAFLPAKVQFVSSELALI